MSITVCATSIEVSSRIFIFYDILLPTNWISCRCSRISFIWIFLRFVWIYIDKSWAQYRQSGWNIAFQFSMEYFIVYLRILLFQFHKFAKTWGERLLSYIFNSYRACFHLSSKIFPNIFWMDYCFLRCIVIPYNKV